MGLLILPQSIMIISSQFCVRFRQLLSKKIQSMYFVQFGCCCLERLFLMLLCFFYNQLQFLVIKTWRNVNKGFSINKLSKRESQYKVERIVEETNIWSKKIEVNSARSILLN